MTTWRKALTTIWEPNDIEPFQIWLAGRRDDWFFFRRGRERVYFGLGRIPKVISELQRIYVEKSKLPTDPLLRFFEYQLLPRHLQEVSKPFSYLAQRIVADLPQTPERTVALRKLLEARRCAIRACLQTNLDIKGE